LTWDDRQASSRTPRVDPWLASLGPALSAALAGPALDLACGLGQNTLWLADLRGRESSPVVGVDASAVAVARARAAARQAGPQLRFDFWDASSDGLPQGPWGTILVLHFLDRSLFPLLEAALAPGGVLAYKTHLRHELRGPEARPRRPAFLLESGELLAAFPNLRTIEYREWAMRGEAFAALLAARPPAQSP
jgi:SAM-dependent methyltransferase